jgi:hypothetical protein
MNSRSPVVDQGVTASPARDGYLQQGGLASACQLEGDPELPPDGGAGLPHMEGVGRSPR